MDRFWKQFETFHNYKIPKVIKDILRNSAIDQSTFDLINEEVIKEIEIEVNKDKSVLKGSIYEKESNENFKFLIGHRHLLLMTIK